MALSACGHEIPVYSKVLPKLDFNRHLPHAFRYAPYSHQGQDLPHVLVMQGTAQICMFLSHMGKHTYVGDIVESCLESASLEIGVGGNIFDHDYELYGHLLTDCWVKTLWEFYWQNNIKLIGSYAWPSTCRVHDQFLMQMRVEYPHSLFSRGEIRLLNRCRLYLQIISLSDLSTGDGRKVCINYMRGVLDPRRSILFLWPNQACPTGRE